MGWRRDEVWFETDVLWFREQPRRPLCRGARVPAFAAGELDRRSSVRSRPGSRPHGGGGSRRSRHEAPPRHTYGAGGCARPRVGHDAAYRRDQASGSGQRAGPLQEDPPSLTFRLDPRASGFRKPPFLREAPPPEARGAQARASSGVREGRVAPRDVGRPPVRRAPRRRHAAPVEGPDWVTWNPVTDSVPNLRTGSTATSTRSARSSP